jgi:KDO2-lipid IV(A) lauroyltransferase
MPLERGRVLRNLVPLCEGDRRRARKEGVKVFQNVARYWVDLVSMPYRDMSSFERQHLHIDHADRLTALEAEGPVVAVSAHTGNAELAVQALTWRGRPYVALVERLEPPSVAEHVARLRTAAGGTFHEADFQGLKALIGALRRGELIGVMGDRDLQHTGVCVQLAGREVRLPRGPWDLARRTNALVVPIFTTRLNGDHFALHAEEPFQVPQTDDPEDDARAAAEHFALILEAHLRREPGQWAVLEDYWRVHGCG